MPEERWLELCPQGAKGDPADPQRLPRGGKCTGGGERESGGSVGSGDEGEGQPGGLVTEGRARSASVAWEGAGSEAGTTAGGEEARWL